MHRNWSTYFNIDAQIRSTARDPRIPNSVVAAETISTGPSNAAFGTFLDSVDRLSAANRGYYNRTYAAAGDTFQRYLLFSTVLFPLLGLAGAWGVYRRIRDF